MKILNNEQIRETDTYTILNEPIASINLMERAASQLMREYVSRFTVKQPVEIYAGPGNNGGDGIALARLLYDKGYTINLFIMKTGQGLSGDSHINFERLPDSDRLIVSWLEGSTPLPDVGSYSIIIDALFGSGLTRPLDGFAADLVNHINTFSNTKIAVDIPSGLFAESNPDINNQVVIKADFTWCFQFPKLSFLMPENELQVGAWKFLDIGLHPDFISAVDTPYHYVTIDNIRSKLIKRKAFSHKGNFGHGLLFAGSKGKVGATILGAKAALRSGIGLLTVHTPGIGVNPVHSAVPEAMLSIDDDFNIIEELPDFSPYSAIGAGPGIGQNKLTTRVIKGIVKSALPLVLDADALNILAENPALLNIAPPGTILTPHTGEYIRLFGPDNDHYTRLMRLRDIAAKRQFVIVLKGAHTAVASPDGELWFNSTGNPGMATAGSGDVLTGIILSLLSQGYGSVDAAVLSVFLHGLAGDLAEKQLGQEGLMAGDIIDQVPHAFNTCKMG